MGPIKYAISEKCVYIIWIDYQTKRFELYGQQTWYISSKSQFSVKLDVTLYVTFKSSELE